MRSQTVVLPGVLLEGPVDEELWECITMCAVVSLSALC